MYFCALLTNPPGNQSSATFAYMQPVLMEFLFVPFDISQQQQLSCSQLRTPNANANAWGCSTQAPLNANTGAVLNEYWPPAAVGMLYYTIHWSTSGPGGIPITNHYNGSLASGCPAG
jgi:hypothetical protein